MVKEQDIPLETAITTLTRNPARVYGISEKKGTLEADKDADVVLLDGEYKVDTVIARGKKLVEGGCPVVRGMLEEHLLEALK